MSNAACQTVASGAGTVKLRLLVLAVFIFYFAALFLNAQALQQSMELMRYGPRRTVAVAVIRPFAVVSRQLGLGKPRQFLEQTLGALIKP